MSVIGAREARKDCEAFPGDASAFAIRARALYSPAVKRTHYRTCNLCEAMCGVQITTENERITRIQGDPEDPLSAGHICPKAVALKDIHEDPDRLTRPQKREGSTWRTISWDQALDEVADRIAKLQSEHGRRALAVYQGNPTVHNHGSMLFGQIFVRTLSTPNFYSATSLDQLPHMLACLKMFGHQLLIPVPDIERTEHLIIMGANPLVSNGSLMSAGDPKGKLKAIQKRGGRVIVIDPRRTQTADLADQHLFIRPGTDALFLLSMLHVLLQSPPRLGHLASMVDGLADIQSLAARFPPERTAQCTGISAAQTRELAAGFASASAAVIYGRVGLSMQEFGGLSTWLLNVINIVTGNLDRPGGAMFTRPAIDVVSLTAKAGQRGSFDRRKSRVRGLPEFGGEFPAAVLAEEIDTAGEGQIRGLLTSAGNPVLSAPNGGRLQAALQKLELMVSIDIYRNETTRFAHYILPPTFALEHGHYDLAFHILATRNTAKYSEALFERPEHARHDWEIFKGLTTRLASRGDSYKARVSQGMAKLALARLTPEHLLELALRAGPYGRRTSLRALKAQPHGIDLGPLMPCLPQRLLTRDKRIPLAPQLYLEDIERLERRLDRAPHGSLSLIGRRELRTNNSWLHNSETMVKGKARCTLLINPQDAQARGLENGALVKVRSRVGEVQTTLQVSEEMMPGVVSLPHGWGHGRPGSAQRVADAHEGVSLNDLTDDALVDELSGTVRFSDVPVEVSG